MDQIAFEIGSLQIRWYGIAMALSMLLGAWIAARLLDRIGRDGEKMWDGLFWIILFGVIGARLGYVLTSSKHIFYEGAKWYEPFAVWHGGLSIHGGVILAAVAAYIYFKRVGIPYLEALDCMAPGVGLGIILVRIGNFMNGDILGYKWNGPLALNFPFDEYHITGSDPATGKLVYSGDFIARHPTELYGMLVGIVTMVAVLVIWNLTYGNRRFKTGGSLFTMIIAYSLARGIIEDPFRAVPLMPQWVDPQTAGWGIMTMSQWASVVLVLFSLWGLSQLANWETKRNKLAAEGAFDVDSTGVVRKGESRQARRARERSTRKRKDGK